MTLDIPGVKTICNTLCLNTLPKVTNNTLDICLFLVCGLLIYCNDIDPPSTQHFVKLLLYGGPCKKKSCVCITAKSTLEPRSLSEDSNALAISHHPQLRFLWVLNLISNCKILISWCSSHMISLIWPSMTNQRWAFATNYINILTTSNSSH